MLHTPLTVCVCVCVTVVNNTFAPPSYPAIRAGRNASSKEKWLSFCRLPRSQREKGGKKNNFLCEFLGGRAVFPSPRREISPLSSLRICPWSLSLPQTQLWLLQNHLPLCAERAFTEASWNIGGGGRECKGGPLKSGSLIFRPCVKTITYCSSALTSFK